MHRHPLLATRTHFSFLEGASSPTELFEEAERLGIPALGIVDRDGVHGAVRAHTAAARTGVRVVHGSEVTLDDGSRVVLLVENRRGWSHLCHLITRGRLAHDKGTSKVTVDDVAEHADGLFALWGGRHAALGHPDAEARERALGDTLRGAFGERLLLAIDRHQHAPEATRERLQRDAARRWNLESVAAPEVCFHTPARKRLHDVMTCIREGVPVDRAGRRLLPNARWALRSGARLADEHADDPACLVRASRLMERCTFGLGDLDYRYPTPPGPDGEAPRAWLERLVFEGARRRYHDYIPDDVHAQLQRELALIDELDYGGYFLSMWEIVETCNRLGILCQGRGSAANSAVCYCLGITAVDPVRLDLLFERFLSRERNEPPDIDLDIEHERREEVIQWVYGRYGRSHAAMVANVIRYRPRSACRDVGRALGLPTTTVDQVARQLGYRGAPTPELLRALGLDPETPLHRTWLDLIAEIEDTPRHLSIHPGGFLLGAEPIASLVPVENATMEHRTVIQWDKDDVETLGLFKVDLLGLGALSHLRRAFALVRRHEGRALELRSLPATCDATWDMLARAKTVGVFQIESRAQMSMLPRLRPRTFYDLVIEISIVRPGPITGDMVHPYLRRRAGEEPVVYPHPSLEPILKKTLGVPLFQEQVMKLAVVAADYTPGEADQLRRDMGAWRKSGAIERHRLRILERMQAKGIAEEFAERVFQQIRGFGEYGFPESHAASFALLTWATAWMRCHHRAAFTCALLNAWPMGFYSPSTVIDEARRDGLAFRPVDRLASAWDNTLEPDDEGPFRFAVRLGFRMVHGLRRDEMERWIGLRDACTASDPAALRASGALRHDALERLAEAGAFDDAGLDRRLALWAAHARPEDAPLLASDGVVEDGGTAPLPALPRLNDGDLLTWDYRATGVSSRGHPLLLLRPTLDAMGLPEASELNTRAHGSRARYVGLVICRQRPSTAGGVVFMTLEDESGFVNLVVWEKVFEAHALVARTATLLGVNGSLQRRDGVTHLIADTLWIPQLDDVRALERSRSRDFH